MIPDCPFLLYDANELVEQAFIEMALEHGFALWEIEAALSRHRISSPFDEIRDHIEGDW